MASSNSLSDTAFIASLVSCIARREPWAKRRAVLSTRSRSWSPGNASFTRPAAKASVALSGWASNAIALAFTRPMEADTNALDPPSGISPILAKAKRKKAVSAA
ncbi:Uncharacterised protein [Mycobacteroides abscessus subsp. abscessus]|nr:Uncharacterised protein [Mycobacteroides abscessus subsp. abscessus]